MAIKCNKCDRMNPDNAIYCGSCGVKLDVFNKEDLNSEMEMRFFYEQEYVTSEKSKQNIIKRIENLGTMGWAIFWIGISVVFIKASLISLSTGEACLYCFQGVFCLCRGVIIMINRLDKYMSKYVKGTTFTLLTVCNFLFFVSLVISLWLY